MGHRALVLLVLLAATAGALNAWEGVTSLDMALMVDMLYHPAYPTTYPAQIQPGDQGVWLDVEMKNYYSLSYYNVTTELMVVEPFEGVVTTAAIDNVMPGETTHAFYQLNVDGAAKPGEYKMLHKLTYYYDYYDSDGVKTVVKIERTKTVSVNVYYSERVEITGITVVPGDVLPGEPVKVTVTLANTGTVTVNDIDVSYTIDTDATAINLMPLGTGTKRVATIQPGEETSAEFELRALEGATVKPYKISVSAVYTSGSGTTTEADSSAINVIGKPKMRLAGVQVDKDTVYAGQTFSLSVQLENIGSGDAKSVKAELKDGAIDGVLTSYIGTVEVDDTGSAIFDVRDGVAGRKSITTLITFEDAYGNTYSEPMQAEYYITEKPMDYATPIIAIVVIAAVAFWYWRGQQKAKRIQQLVK